MHTYHELTSRILVIVHSNAHKLARHLCLWCTHSSPVHAAGISDGANDVLMAVSGGETHALSFSAPLTAHRCNTAGSGPASFGCSLSWLHSPAPHNAGRITHMQMKMLDGSAPRKAGRATTSRPCASRQTACRTGGCGQGSPKTHHSISASASPCLLSSSTGAADGFAHSDTGVCARSRRLCARQVHVKCRRLTDDLLAADICLGGCSNHEGAATPLTLQVPRVLICSCHQKRCDWCGMLCGV